MQILPLLLISLIHLLYASYPFPLIEVQAQSAEKIRNEATRLKKCHKKEDKIEEIIKFPNLPRTQSPLMPLWKQAATLYPPTYPLQTPCQSFLQPHGRSEHPICEESALIRKKEYQISTVVMALQPPLLMQQ